MALEVLDDAPGWIVATAFDAVQAHGLFPWLRTG
jgi:hypothetical protein